MSFPTWVWLYFGTGGTIGAILFTLVVWNWMKVNNSAKGLLRSAAKWNMVGLLFLFLGAWFACGIGGPPGSLLSSDIETHNPDIAYINATLSMLFSLPGWACILVGQKRMVKAIK